MKPRRRSTEEPSLALPALTKLIDRAEDVLARHAPLHGLTHREAILELVRIFGSMDARDALSLAGAEKKNRRVDTLVSVIESAIKILVQRAAPRSPADHVIIEQLVDAFESPILKSQA